MQTAKTMGLVRALAFGSGLALGLVNPALARTAARPPTSLPAAGAQVPSPGALTPEQAAQDAGVLQNALKALHPALVKYRSAAEMDAAFARFDSRAKAAKSAAQMYLAATELAAAIRCGHTWTNVRNQSGAARAALLDAPDKLPITLSLVEGRWLVLASADRALRAGDEIYAINGVSTPQVVAQLMPYLRADGSSDGKRLRQLSHDRPDTSQVDIVLPLLLPPANGMYVLGVRRSPKGAAVTGSVAAVAGSIALAPINLNIKVKATSLAARDAALHAQGVRPIDESFAFEVKNNVGYLKLPTFSFWNSKFDWAAFINTSFAQLQAQSVPNLVIDIRDNEGGDGAIGNLVLSHLITKPLGYEVTQSVTAYERVPYELARYLDTWDFSFFDRTGDVLPITEGTAKGLYQLKSRPAAQEFIQPLDRPYRGKTYLLVGPENSSATFVMAHLAQQSGAATLVGQPTGGNLRGLNGGQLLWVTLPNSGVAVDIPLLAARYSANTPDTSVQPDVPVKPSFAARAAGLDLDLQAVQRLIATGAP